MTTITRTVDRTIDVVWEYYTIPGNWIKWYGIELKSVTPGWEAGAELDWGMATPSTIKRLTVKREVEITGESGDVVFKFDSPGASTTVIEVEIASPGDGNSSPYDNAAQRGQWERTLNILKFCIENETEAPAPEAPATSRFYIEDAYLYVELGRDINLIGDFFELLQTNRIEFDLKNVLEMNFNDLRVVKLIPEKDLCRVTVSDDKLYAFLTISPVFPGSLTALNIFEQLTKLKINAGIDQELIETTLESGQPVIDLVIAQGEAPKLGSPQIIIEHYNPTDKIEFKVDEDGNVDFKNLDNIINIKKGTILATRTREFEPEPGYDIFGNIIEPPPPININFAVGKGIIVVGDEAIAYRDGYVERDDRDRLGVNNTMIINGDVAYATGNLNVEGNILIKGDILPGFSVRSSGNIDILGSAEDALIQAVGDINIRGSVVGKKGCDIEANGDISVYYAQNSRLKCLGSIYVKRYIYNSQLMSEEMIFINSQEGVILGDSNKIIAKNAIYIRNILQDKPLEIALVGFSIAECTDLLDQVERGILNKLGEIRDISSKKSELLALKNESKNNNDLFDLLSREQSFRDDLNHLNKMKKDLSYIIHRIPPPGIVEIEKSLCSKLTVSIGSRSLEVPPFREKRRFVSDDGEECLIIK
ncbi:MAG: FapA family protein [Syntrophomonadaceae bacterium]